MAAAEKIPYERDLYFMAKEITEKQREYLYTLANTLFFNGEWNPDARLEYKDMLIDGILYEAEKCMNEKIVHFCFTLLYKTNEQREKGKAAI